MWCITNEPLPVLFPFFCPLEELLLPLPLRHARQLLSVVIVADEIFVETVVKLLVRPNVAFLKEESRFQSRIDILSI